MIYCGGGGQAPAYSRVNTGLTMDSRASSVGRCIAHSVWKERQKRRTAPALRAAPTLLPIFFDVLCLVNGGPLGDGLDLNVIVPPY